MDNACIESFHAVIKREWLNRFIIHDLKHTKRLVFEYIETFYNTNRIHEYCSYQSPNDYESRIINQEKISVEVDLFLDIGPVRKIQD